MRDAFIDYLGKHAPKFAANFSRLNKSIRTAPEPIGSIAFKYGLISCDDIDLILDEQRKNHRQFGVIATEMGMLTNDQINILLRIQQIRYSVETAEALALSGCQPIDEITQLLGKFLSSTSTLQTV